MTIGFLWSKEPIAPMFLFFFFSQNEILFNPFCPGLVVLWYILCNLLSNMQGQRVLREALPAVRTEG